MKAVKFFLIFAVLAWFGVLAFVGNKIYQGYASADPLRAEKVELQKVRILKDIEDLRVQQEVEQRETAIVKAKLARQERIEKNAGVSFAAVTLAMFWRLFPVLTFGTALTGGLVYAFTRRVKIESPVISGAFPRKDALAIAQTALTVANSEAMGKALAFSEDITRARIADMTDFARAIRPGRETVNISNAPALSAATQQAAAVPTFAALLSAGEIGEGLPLLMGFTRDGQPQRRTIADLKAVSVAGQQGAGKTGSMAYLITSTLLLSDEAEAYVIDPHWKHPEGLGAMIQPLAMTGRLHLINPMNIEATIDALDKRLDRRLAGQESSAAPVLFCVDELAKMGKTPVFAEKLLPFVERFTEETRKAGMVGVFGSQKWNARHFGNKADIRATIPSLLIHRIKPSQADLLLEDSENKKLMKQVSLPGQALMATSHDADPSVITVPLITRKDVEEVARMLSAKYSADVAQDDVRQEMSVETHEETNEPANVSEVKCDNVVPFRRRNAEETAEERQTKTETAFLSADTLREILAEKLARNEETLSGIANKANVSKGQLYRFLKENQNPSENLLTALQVFAGTAGTPANPTGTEAQKI